MDKKIDLMSNHAVLSDFCQARILIVDDNPANVALLEAILEEESFDHLVGITDPFQVVPLCRQQSFDLILLDIRMPGMSGIEVMHQLKDVTANDFLPVIVLTAQTDPETRQEALKAGANDFLTKPFEDWEVLLRIRNTLQTRQFYIREVNRGDLLEDEVRKRTEEILATQFEIVQRLGVAGELRDNETGVHVQRMSQVCAFLAQQYGKDPHYCELLRYASAMHDVGKIGIPDNILLKPGKLTPEEWAIMKQHPEIGARIIGNNPSALIQLARETALYHHEKWDGSGYPFGIRGEDIPLSARLAAISDVFDALTSDRPYKQAWSTEDAVAELKKEAGRHFDPAIVELFVENLPQILSIRAGCQAL